MPLKVFLMEILRKFSFYYVNYLIFESTESDFCLNL
jgi:hypothetical protein